MATLWLLRHAKAETFGRGGPDDKARALTRRGRKQASGLGSWVASKPKALEGCESPELILCSSSRRTHETLAGFLGASGLRPRVEILDSLYEADPEALHYLLTGYPMVSSILVVGHQPTMGLFREDLLKTKHRSERPTRTCSLAVLGFPADVISEIVPGTGKLRAMVDRFA